MESIIECTTESSTLKNVEAKYNKELHKGAVSDKMQFEYAYCLVHSRYSNDIRKGNALLEDLIGNSNDDTSKRDYIFYLAVGYTKLKDYEMALRCVDAVQKIEANNCQAKDLRNYIKKKMKYDGLLGMAIVGGTALAVGGLVGAGIMALKK